MSVFLSENTCGLDKHFHIKKITYIDILFDPKLILLDLWENSLLSFSNRELIFILLIAAKCLLLLFITTDTNNQSLVPKEAWILQLLIEYKIMYVITKYHPISDDSWKDGLPFLCLPKKLPYVKRWLPWKQ